MPAFALAAVALAAAGFDSSSFAYRMLVRVDEPDRVSVIRIDRAIYARSRLDLGDLRVVRSGQEIPYRIDKRTARTDEREERARILRQIVLPGRGVEVTLDLGEGAHHARVRMATGETNFRSTVRVETSDDERFWTTVRDDAWIFDFTQGERKMSLLAVNYTSSRHRYVRLTMAGWSSPGAVRDAWAGTRDHEPAERDPIDASPAERSEDPATQSTLFLVDLG
ncbi:MAG: DUF3999 family protein, partial [Bryobacteraceae bacterium]